MAECSGGGSLALCYQAQAEKPSVTHAPASDLCNIMSANPLPAAGLSFRAAHVSRSVVLSGWIDPSGLDENDPARGATEPTPTISADL